MQYDNVVRMIMINSKKVIPIKVAFEFLLVFVLLTPDKMELAWSRPRMRNVRESLSPFKIRYARERGTFVNIKCFRSFAFSESFPIAGEKKLMK